MVSKLLISTFLALSFLGATSMLLPASQVSAATAAECKTESTSFLGFPTWYKYLDPQFADGECTLKFPVDSEGEESFVLGLPRILLAVFEIILRISGLAAVGFIIYGGVRYILSQGEPEQTKASKNTVLNALIGLVIAMMATAIVNLIGRNIA